MDTQAFDFLAEIPQADPTAWRRRHATRVAQVGGLYRRFSGSANRLARFEEFAGEQLGRQRRAEDEALDLLAAFVGEEALLAFGFHAFGDHRELHAAAEGDDGAGDGGIVGIVGEAADERLVDLQDVQRQALEVAERGV